MVQTYHMVTSVADPRGAHWDASIGDPPPEPPLPLPLPGNDLQRPCLPRATGCGAEGSGDRGAHRANRADGAEGMEMGHTALYRGRSHLWPWSPLSDRSSKYDAVCRGLTGTVKEWLEARCSGGLVGGQLGSGRRRLGNLRSPKETK